MEMGVWMGKMDRYVNLSKVALVGVLALPQAFDIVLDTILYEYSCPKYVDGARLRIRWT